VTGSEARSATRRPAFDDAPIFGAHLRLGENRHTGVILLVSIIL
jgi:hypothetical protein